MAPTERLLEEYKLCQNKTQQIEDTIWKTSGAIGFSSLGTFIATLFQNDPKWQTALILGFLVSAMSIIWWFMAQRWWNIQHATFLRMKHLEKELHFYQVRYIYHKDGKHELRQDGGSNLSQDDIDGLDNWNKTFHLSGVQSWLRLLPSCIIPVSWATYTFYQWNRETNYFQTLCPTQFMTQFILFVPWVALFLVILIGILVFNYFCIHHDLSPKIQGVIEKRYQYDIEKEKLMKWHYPIFHNSCFCLVGSLFNRRKRTEIVKLSS
jgi:hypothetical protein